MPDPISPAYNKLDPAAWRALFGVGWTTHKGRFECLRTVLRIINGPSTSEKNPPTDTLRPSLLETWLAAAVNRQVGLVAAGQGHSNLTHSIQWRTNIGAFIA